MARGDSALAIRGQNAHEGQVAIGSICRITASIFAISSYFRRMHVGIVGTAHIAPPLPTNRKPGLVPDFFVPDIRSFDVRFTPESGRSVNIRVKGRK